MKKSAILKLKSIFGSKRGKRHQEQHNSQKSSRSGSPEPTDGLSPSSGESFRPLQRTPPPSRIGPPPSPPVPTKPVAPVAPEPTGPLPLAPCPVCGRTFVPQSLAKHVKICEKMTIKKRKTFDSSRQRREGTDLEQYLPKNFGLPENSPFLEKSPPNTAKATPKPKVQSVRSAIMKPTADLQKCPHCGRAFGVRAFERHVEWCADKAKILPAAPAQPPAHIADAKQRLNARTQYKAPPVRTRRSSQTREKSSNSRSASVESSRGISPPREYGDYKHPRSRASESASSNDHEESSPHVPVIRNSRASQNKSSGDANIKARQARLARDLSSSRNNQENNIAPLQQCNTDPDVNKKEKDNKPKVRMTIKKKQQLKKLEELAEKHKEKSQKILAKVQRASKVTEKTECPSKSQIPLLKKEKIVKKTIINKDIPQKETVNIDKESTDNNITKQAQVAIKEINIKTKTKKDVSRRQKESTMSLDSLEDCPQKSTREQNSQSIGINTELLCPCVPCVIHDLTPPKQKKKNEKSSHLNKIQADKCESELFTRNQIMENSSSVELLYKNPSMVSSCDNSKELREQADCDETETGFYQAKVPFYHSSSDAIDFTDNIKRLENLNEYSDTNIESKTDVFKNISSGKVIKEDSKQYIDLSNEHFDENYERDLSEDSLDCDEKENVIDDEDQNNLVSRHGSGDTYTKFIDNPADLEEFLTLTDDMICDTNNKKEITDKDIEHIHTPKTNSIESICANSNKDILTKHSFSDTIEELKNNFKEILQETQDENAEDDLNRKVSDMEHITVYELKFYDQKSNAELSQTTKQDSDVKLPAIEENNKLVRKGLKSKNNISNIYKNNRKCEMLNKTNKEYRTFIIKENREESSDEAPPLKLPRIDLKSSNNIVGEKLFPSSVKRSTSLLDSIQKKPSSKVGTPNKTRQKTDQLEDDIMQSLKEFDKFYETQKHDKNQSHKDITKMYIDTVKRDSRKKCEQKMNKNDNVTNGNHTPSGKISNDSAYSSLNRVSPSKLSLCNVKESNDLVLLEQIPAGSESSDSHKEDRRSISSEEFLAMERSTELQESLTRSDMHSSYNNVGNPSINDKHTNSRTSTHRSASRRQNTKEALSSSGSETSLHRSRRESAPTSAPRLSRFCHECGSKFPVDTAKFCIECGVKRLLV
ncbi:uncharacterized protein LOC119839880 isoform X5 [Zerene cesonia]|uniref:uncharacterized protein LOC119839880 isoform X5 n=1 Tax=Zerene cesonia TaxID=33412 RepID=UPI0018E54274|nr:uncharacterized protein LOC119839880 isoform X5 [Zerene cesonia]